MTNTDSKEPLIEMVIPLAYWESKGKRELVTLNNTHKWKRWSEKKVKDQYKTILIDFYIPDPPSAPFDSLDITYEILRHNRSKVDGDNLSWSYKWFVDTLVKCKWLSDDDQVYYHVVPSVYTEGIAETQLRVIIREVQ